MFERGDAGPAEPRVLQFASQRLRRLGVGDRGGAAERRRAGDGGQGLDPARLRAVLPAARPGDLERHAAAVGARRRCRPTGRCRRSARWWSAGEACPTELAERAGRRAPAGQRLRPDRDHGLHRHARRRVPASRPAAARPRRSPASTPTCSTAAASRCRPASPGELYVGGVGSGARLSRRARADRRALRARSVLGASPGGGSTAPATWCAGPADGRARVPRPHRPPGQGARLPHRAGRDRARAARALPTCGRRWWSREADGGAEKRLVAYVVPRSDGPDSAPLDAGSCALPGRTLPEYMVPAAFVTLAELPRTPSGKVDRRALPDPARGGRGGARDRGAAKRRSKSSWPACSPRCCTSSASGIDDNFFELGGNSITGAMLINRLQEELGEIVYVVALFDAPTVAGLAAYLSRTTGGGGPPLWARGRGAAARGRRAGSADRPRRKIGGVPRAGAAAPSGPARRRTKEPAAPSSCCRRRAPARRSCASCSPAIRGCSRRPSWSCCRSTPCASGATPSRPRQLLARRGGARGDGAPPAAAADEAARRWSTPGSRRADSMQRFYRRLQELARRPRLLVDKTPVLLARSEHPASAPRGSSKGRATST